MNPVTAKERVMRIGFHLLAVVLIGGLSTGASLAEDAVGHAAGGATATPPAQTAGAAPTAGNGAIDSAPKSEDHGPAKIVDAPANGEHPDGGDRVGNLHGDTAAKDNVRPEGMKDLGPIDSRIAPPSRRFGRYFSDREA